MWVNHCLSLVFVLAWKERGTFLSLITEDFENALEGFTPAALRGVTLHTAGELGWTDVGGLTAVKDALMETLLWPTKVGDIIIILFWHWIEMKMNCVSRDYLAVLSLHCFPHEVRGAHLSFDECISALRLPYYSKWFMDF